MYFQDLLSMRGDFRNSKMPPELLMLGPIKTFGEDIGNHVVCRNIFHIDLPFSENFTDVMVTDIDVLC